MIKINLLKKLFFFSVFPVAILLNSLEIISAEHEDKKINFSKIISFNQRLFKGDIEIKIINKNYIHSAQIRDKKQERSLKQYHSVKSLIISNNISRKIPILY